MCGIWHFACTGWPNTSLLIGQTNSVLSKVLRKQIFWPMKDFQILNLLRKQEWIVFIIVRIETPSCGHPLDELCDCHPFVRVLVLTYFASQAFVVLCSMRRSSVDCTWLNVSHFWMLISTCAWQTFWGKPFRSSWSTLTSNALEIRSFCRCSWSCFHTCLLSSS